VTQDKIRVLIAEDSPTARRLLVRILEQDPEIEIVGEAKNGAEAVAMASTLDPSVITMDIHMPLLDGFEATKQIMASRPAPIVIVSSLDVDQVAFSMNAIRAGALAVLAKPAGPTAPDFAQASRTFVATVKAMAKVRLPSSRGAPRERAPEHTTPTPQTRRASRIKAVALAASTGGPSAIHTILAHLPADFPAPLLVVQHIAIGFAEGFTTWLESGSKLRVKVAEAGEPLMAGTVYVAPDQQHLGVSIGLTGLSDARVSLSSAAPIMGLRPSATHLYTSVGATYGPAAAGVILTGLGDDGVEGLRAMQSVGGWVIAQDETSSTVFGMPGAAIEAAVVDEVLSLGAIAGRLVELAMRGEG